MGRLGRRRHTRGEGPNQLRNRLALRQVDVDHADILAGARRHLRWCISMIDTVDVRATKDVRKVAG